MSTSAPDAGTPAVEAAVGLAPEDQLLLECCRVEAGEDGRRRAAILIEAGLDWDYLVEASIRHNVSPLFKLGLDQVLGEYPTERVPARALSDLDALYQGSARRNARLLATLAEVAAQLREAGAEAVGLKDVMLAAEIYPEPGLRPMGDVDLLVRSEDYDRAADALATIGFQPLPRPDVPYTRKYARAQHFRRAADDVWIDLQSSVMQREWDLYGEGSFTYDGERMWQDAVPIRGVEIGLRVPTFEDMLFHLCLHLEGHGYCELVLFCDIAELLRSKGGELDWSRFVGIAKGYRAQSSVYYVLLLTERLLGARAPDDVMEALTPPFFDGSLVEPVFDNLSSLHLSLDEIRLTVAPPPRVLDGYERVSRRQTAWALSLDRELRNLASSFVSAGGRVVVFHGSPSRRLFPDTTQPAFEPLHLLVWEGDRERLAAAAVSQGFTTTGNGAYTKRLVVGSVDPVLAGSESTLELELEIAADIGCLLEGTTRQTNKRAALESLRARLRGALASDDRARVQITAHAVSPDEIIAAAAALVGLDEAFRLLRVCDLLEVLGKLPAPLDASRVREIAAGLGVERETAAGLRIARALGTEIPESVESRRSAWPAPRVFEWARYGPSTMNRYPWLRPAYYFALSLLATDGARAKLTYLLRSVVSPRPPRVLLPSLFAQVGAGALRSLARPVHTPREFAYWVEPDTARRLSASSGADADG